jgi:hypothetical protein
MARLALCLILQEVEGSIDPGFGNRPGGADPGYGRPGGAHPSQPIFHPGHPDHGLPSAPARPGHDLPWSPGHPDAGLPVPPGITLPAPPPNLQGKVVVLWHRPGDTQWHGKVIEPGHPDAGLPESGAQPKA